MTNDNSVGVKISPDLRIVAGGLSSLATIDLNVIIIEVLSSVTPNVELAIRQETPVRTGQGAESITADISFTGRGARIAFTGAHHLEYVLQGTEAHLIEPSNSTGVLAFVAQSGDLIFTKQVNHPGTKANPFVRRAWDRVYPDVLAQVKAAGLKAFRENVRTWYRP